MRYWNIARQRYYRSSARCCWTLCVSVDRAAHPSPHTRGKPRLLDVGRRILARDRFAPDSPLEGNGFELPVRGSGEAGCRPFFLRRLLETRRAGRRVAVQFFFHERQANSTEPGLNRSSRRGGFGPGRIGIADRPRTSDFANDATPRAATLASGRIGCI